MGEITGKRFGCVFSIFFALLTLLLLIQGKGIRPLPLLLCASFTLATLTIPDRLAPFGRLWMKFGEIMHRWVSPFALTILYFAVVTPVGLLMRATGKDPMRRKRDHEAKSYWIERADQKIDPLSMSRQF
jgi:hypothetical protein